MASSELENVRLHGCENAERTISLYSSIGADIEWCSGATPEHIRGRIATAG